MQVNNIKNYNTSFCSKIMISPKTIDYLKAETPSTRRIFNKHLANLEKNGKDDTVYIDYLDIYDSAPYRYCLEVIKKTGNKLFKSPKSGIYENEQFDVEQAYNRVSEKLKPVKKDVFSKYIVR